MLIKVNEKTIKNSVFTADQHFGHANIIEFTNRPFKNVAHMNRSLVEAWNEVVKPDTTVYHLGDFTLGEIPIARDFLSQLNGQIKILGMDWHHDRRWLFENKFYETKDGMLEILPPMVVIEVYNYLDTGRPLPITLCHYPIASWDRKHYNSWHLHGHSHNNHMADGLILDVGVDSHINYAPYTFDMVAVMMSAKMKNEAEITKGLTPEQWAWVYANKIPDGRN